MSRWESFDMKKIPYGGDCVYVIYSGKTAVYVGHTTHCLYMRMAQHRCTKAAWLSLPGLSVKASYNRMYGEHAMRELRLIAKIRPPHNKSNMTGAHKPWIPYQEQSWHQALVQQKESSMTPCQHQFFLLGAGLCRPARLFYSNA